MSDEIKINPIDNVVVSLISDEQHQMGHKYALRQIERGEAIIKYGSIIGTATATIKAGDHVHTHNITTTLGDDVQYSYEPVFNYSLNQTPNSSSTESNTTTMAKKTVQVYERFNGEVGIRNELWVIPTVGCTNGIAKTLIKTFEKKLIVEGIDVETLTNFDGLHTFTHEYGCSQMGDDHLTTKESLQNIVKHPNAGGVLVLGLGCENNQVDAFFDTLGDYDQNRVASLIAQDVDNEIEAGCDILMMLFKQMMKDQRVEKPLSVLKVGLECGGSDGLSGVTANPLVGQFSDFLIANGGTTLLTEVPEMFGAEISLMNRCINEHIFKKTVDMINDFKDYYRRNNQVIYDNPSPGNKNGGISTLEDKSLGCITKSGQSPVMDVLKMTERLHIQGLNLISAPGNDLVATTVLGMSGCHMVLFTTGRGTPFGGFVPTVKIATNHGLAAMKGHWIDFDAGRLITGTSREVLLEEFIDLVIKIANGKYTKQEINDFREIAIFKSGVIL